MMLGSIYRKVCRWPGLMLLAGGGTVFAVVPGCDPEVSNLLVDGLESAASTAATSIIQALFETVTRDSGGGAVDTVPTVMLDTLHHLATMLA